VPDSPKNTAASPAGREYRFLHLAGIIAAADQDDALGEVDRHHGLAAHAVAVRIGLEGRQAQDGEIGNIMA
jgi:hypothetical protein